MCCYIYVPNFSMSHKICLNRLFLLTHPVPPSTCHILPLCGYTFARVCQQGQHFALSSSFIRLVACLFLSFGRSTSPTRKHSFGVFAQSIGACPHVFIRISPGNPQMYISKFLSSFSFYLSASLSLTSFLSFISVLYPPNFFRWATYFIIGFLLARSFHSFGLRRCNAIKGRHGQGACIGHKVRWCKAGETTASHANKKNPRGARRVRVTMVLTSGDETCC